VRPKMGELCMMMNLGVVYQAFILNHMLERGRVKSGWPKAFGGNHVRNDSQWSSQNLTSPIKLAKLIQRRL